MPEEKDGTQTITQEGDEKKGEVSQEKAVEEKLYEDKSSEKKSQPEPDKGTPKQESVVPEKYDLKLPEGSSPDEGYIQGLEKFARDSGLSNDEAQSLLERESNLKAAIYDGQKEELAKQAEVWLGETKQDSELGGDKFNENIEIAKRALLRFGSDKLRKDLNETGLGNHPELIRAWFRVGNTMRDDKLIHQGAESKPEVPLEDVFYPTNKK